MQPESFESKIRRLASGFERQAPPESWEYIQQRLQPTPRQLFSAATLGMMALAGALLLFTGIEVIRCFTQPVQEEVTPPVKDPGEEFSKGQDLFIADCATCHNRNMIDDMIGPALAGVRDRWSAYPKEDLYNYIRNSQKMLAEGHDRALEIRAEWRQGGLMPSFPNLTDGDLEQVLSYVEWRCKQH